MTAPAGTIAPAEKSSAKKRLAGTTVGIPPRQMDFRFPADAERYFFDQNAFASMFFATLSGFFPPGERFFVESVRYYRDRISDPVMKAKVSGFIGQEAIHGREHDRLNDMLTSRGIKVWIADRAVRAGLGVLERFSPSQQLACTIFMEHFTALLAEQLLTDERFRARADAEIIPLWMWHALEELEHKAVAYDVYEQVSGSYLHRVLAVPLTAIALTPAVVASMVWMLAAEGQLRNREDRERGWKFLFARRGFVARIMPKMTDFLARDFHPDQHDTTALVEEWRERFFGNEGSLLDVLKNREAVMH